jgi:hypothetical protein
VSELTVNLPSPGRAVLFDETEVGLYAQDETTFPEVTPYTDLCNGIRIETGVCVGFPGRVVAVPSRTVSYDISIDDALSCSKKGAESISTLCPGLILAAHMCNLQSHPSVSV